MILATLLLAVFVAWPLVFGNKQKGLEEAAEARSVAMRSPPKASFVLATAVAARPAESRKPESCYQRYQREVKQCAGADMAGCKLGAADHWDMCEATGFWPN